MKKTLGIAFIAVLATAATACGKGDSNSNSAGSTDGSSSTVVAAQLSALPSYVNTHENTNGVSHCYIRLESNLSMKRLSLIGSSDNYGSVCPAPLIGVGSLTFDCHEDGTCSNTNNYGDKTASLTFRLVLVNSSTIILYQDTKPAGSKDVYTTEVRFYN